MSKNYFQNIHYQKQKPNFALFVLLVFAEFFYKQIIRAKNYLYEKEIFKEKEVESQVICVGNLTTGGVGKTPIVIELAKELSKTKKIAIISRGYKAKISNKIPNIIKDYAGLKYEDGTLCADEPFQIAKKVPDNVIVITCKDRYKASKLAIKKYGVETIILDDGFSNRKLKKDRAIIVIDSKMRFGSSNLLPLGPLREPVGELKRADEIIIVDKGDEKIDEAILWAKGFNKPLKLCKMCPDRVYNLQTKAPLINYKKQKAVAFCAIAQPAQFFDFADKYYDIVQNIAFDDHHIYNKNDIQSLIKIAQENSTNIFITTQKDETKLKELLCNVKNSNHYTFNVLELKSVIAEIN